MLRDLNTIQKIISLLFHERNKYNIVCQICFDPEFRNYHKFTSKCIHKDDACLKCINEYINTKIDEFESISQFNQNVEIKITCPIQKCNGLMERNDIKKFATEDVYERYDFLTFKLAIQKTPGFRWCQASCESEQVSCESGQIHIGEDPIFMCKGCDKNSCYTHGIPWHENQTCEKFDEMNEPLETATKRCLAKSTRCPKCNLHIDKTYGCDHMTCKCTYEFCISCLHEYPGHNDNCKSRLNRFLFDYCDN